MRMVATEICIASDEWFGPAISVWSWFSGYTMTIYVYISVYGCIAVACNSSAAQYDPLCTDDWMRTMTWLTHVLNAQVFYHMQ